MFCFLNKTVEAIPRAGARKENVLILRMPHFLFLHQGRLHGEKELFRLLLRRL